MTVVMLAKSWDTVTANGFGVRPAPEMGQRFLPVFDTLDEAKTHYPNGPFQEVREIVP